MVKLIAHLGMEGTETLLLDFIKGQANPNKESILAARTLLKSGHTAHDALAKSEGPSFERLSRSLGATGDERAVTRLVRMIEETERDLAVRQKLIGAIASSSRGEKQLFEMAKIDKLPTDLKFTTAAVLGRSRDRQIPRRHRQSSQSASHPRSREVSADSKVGASERPRRQRSCSFHQSHLCHLPRGERPRGSISAQILPRSATSFPSKACMKPFSILAMPSHMDSTASFSREMMTRNWAATLSVRPRRASPCAWPVVSLRPWRSPRLRNAKSWLSRSCHQDLPRPYPRRSWQISSLTCAH